MSTLADIRKAAEVPIRTSHDDTTPDGHFTATTKILGITTTYLLAADLLADPEATIVGRVESGLTFLNAYAGAGIKGGRLLSGASDEAEAFQRMVEDR